MNLGRSVPRKCFARSRSAAEIAHRFCILLMLLSQQVVPGQDQAAAQQQKTSPPSKREYRDFAAVHDGDVSRGRELFNNEQRLGCAKCHSVDGTSSKAGPDLYAVGDKFPRSELIRAVLEPSAEIAIGYGTTIVETRSGDEVLGIVKQATADAIELMGADAKAVRIPTSDIQEQRGS